VENFVEKLGITLKLEKSREKERIGKKYNRRVPRGSDS
jgi:hypothetical protein